MTGRAGDRHLQIAIFDPSGRQRFTVECARHQHVDAGDTAQRRACRREALVAETEEWIDRYEVLERPKRRDLVARSVDGGVNRRPLQGAGWLDIL